jgi:hypothetical protein
MLSYFFFCLVLENIVDRQGAEAGNSVNRNATAVIQKRVG